MVAAAQASSPMSCTADAMAPGAAMADAPAPVAQPNTRMSRWGDQGPAVGVLLAVAVSLPLWALVVAIASMVIA